jgi:hypothetical protein
MFRKAVYNCYPAVLQQIVYMRRMIITMVILGHILAVLVFIRLAEEPLPLQIQRSAAI